MSIISNFPGESNLADRTPATATASNILSGNTAWVNGNKITGTMTNRGAVNSTLTNNNSAYVIPSGFHSGNGKVTANITNLTSSNIRKDVTVGGVLGTFTSDANATMHDIAMGKTAYVNGNKIYGNYSPPEKGYKLIADDNLFNNISAKIQNSSVILNLTGTLSNAILSHLLIGADVTFNDGSSIIADIRLTSVNAKIEGQGMTIDGNWYQNGSFIYINSYMDMNISYINTKRWYSSFIFYMD